LNGLRFFVVLLLVGIGCLAHATESRPWDVQIVIGAPATTHDGIVAALDGAAAAQGLTRTPGAGGIDELVGRNVVFFSYGLGRNEPLLMITDVKKPREFLVWAFVDRMRPGFVESIVSDFLSRIRPIEGVTIREERR
jgi:hypothetical protein